MFRRTLFKVLSPISRAIGKLHLAPSSRRCKAANARAIAAIAQPGDVLLSRMNGELSNVAIEGYWGHAAMFLGGEIPTIIDSVAEGVRERDLFDFILSKDNAVLLRPNLPEKTRYAAACIAIQFVGRPYDFLFETTTDAFYCSELVWASLNQASINTLEEPFKFTLRNVCGEYTVLPQDFLNATKHFETLYKCFEE